MSAAINGRVILKKASRKAEEEAKELEGIIIGQYYYCLYYEVEESELNEDSSGQWVSVYYDGINIISVSRCHVENETEYSPMYEFEASFFRELQKECANHAEEYYQDELIDLHNYYKSNEYKYND